MAKQLNRSDIECSTRSALRKYGLGISWKDWIFDESTRRLDFHPPDYNEDDTNLNQDYP